MTRYTSRRHLITVPPRRAGRMTAAQVLGKLRPQFYGTRPRQPDAHLLPPTPTPMHRQPAPLMQGPALGATHLSVHPHNRAHSVRMRLEAHKAVRALQVQRRGQGRLVWCVQGLRRCASSCAAQ